MTGQMMEKLEAVMIREAPVAVLVYGDTNSTLAAALAAAKLLIPVAHVEAGLRSFNRSMPEEINRVCTDHVSTWLYCSSDAGAKQLAMEGINKGVMVVGDVMADVFFQTMASLPTAPSSLSGTTPYELLTIHRADTASDAATLERILAVVGDCCPRVIFPAHPRTRKLIQTNNLTVPQSIELVEPVGYPEMVGLLKNCSRVITDSGGVQKEAYWAEKPCVTLRTETEWVETVEVGWNRIVGVGSESIREALLHPSDSAEHPSLYGDGHAAQRIAEHLVAMIRQPQA